MRTRKWAVIATAAIIFAACASDDDEAATTTAGEEEAAEADGKPYQIAVVGDLTGRVATEMGGAVAGIRTYIDHVNANGGIDGRPIEVGTPYDLQSDPAAAPGVFREVITSEPLGILAAPLSTGFSASVELLEAEGIPLVSPNAFADLLTPPAEWYFSTYPDVDQQVEAMLGQAEAELGTLDGARIAMVINNTVGFEAYVDYAEEVSGERGFEVAATERADFGVVSFDSQASNLVNANVDAIFMVMSAQDTTVAVDALGAAGYDGPIIASSAATNRAVLEAIENPSYVSLIANRFPENIPDLMEAAEAAGTTDHAVTPWFTNGWSSGHVMVEGLRACHPDCDRASLTEALNNLGEVTPPYDVLFGPLKYTPDRHDGHTKVGFVSYADGSLEYTDPIPVE